MQRQPRERGAIKRKGHLEVHAVESELSCRAAALRLGACRAKHLKAGRDACVESDTYWVISYMASEHVILRTTRYITVMNDTRYTLT